QKTTIFLEWPFSRMSLCEELVSFPTQRNRKRRSQTVQRRSASFLAEGEVGWLGPKRPDERARTGIVPPLWDGGRSSKARKAARPSRMVSRFGGEVARSGERLRVASMSAICSGVGSNLQTMVRTVSMSRRV